MFGVRILTTKIRDNSYLFDNKNPFNDSEQQQNVDFGSSTGQITSNP